MGAGIDEVARRAGVSTATVSRALRGLPDVREATRARVREVAAELNYVPSPQATSLATGRTRTIGLLAASFSRWFNRNVLEGAERTLRAAGFDVLLHAFDFDPDHTRAIIDVTALRQRVDGMLVLGVPLADAAREHLRTLGVPTVFVGTAPPDEVRVRMDDVACSDLAIDHLAALGHRVVGQIGAKVPHETRWSAVSARAEAAAAAIVRNGCVADASLTVNGDFTQESGRAAADALLDARPDLTALYVHSDEMAFGALEAIRARGMRVPEDVSLLGVDGHELDGLLGLTSVEQDAAAQGETGARLLLDMLAGADVERDVLFPAVLVPRASSGPARPTAS